MLVLKGLVTTVDGGRGTDIFKDLMCARKYINGLIRLNNPVTEMPLFFLFFF